MNRKSMLRFLIRTGQSRALYSPSTALRDTAPAHQVKPQGAAIPDQIGSASLTIPIPYRYRNLNQPWRWLMRQWDSTDLHQPYRATKFARVHSQPPNWTRSCLPNRSTTKLSDIIGQSAPSSVTLHSALLSKTS